MKKLQTLAWLLSFSTLTSLAMSCGTSTPSASDTADVQSETSETVAETAEYTAPDRKYEGKTFTVFEEHNVNNYVICNYNYITAEEENGDSINDGIYRRTRAVEEALKITVDVFSNQTGSVTPLINSVMAGDDTYQSAIVRIGLLKNLMGSDGLLYDLRTIDTLRIDASWVNQNANSEYNIGGKQYVMIDQSCLRTTLSMGAMYYNKDLVSQYNLEDPYKLVDEGRWTLDTFAQSVRKCSRDLNGDNVMDTKDLFGLSASATVMKQAVSSCGIRVTTKNKDGVSELTLNNERMINTIDKLLVTLCDYSINAMPSKMPSTGDVWYNTLLPMFKNDQLMFNFNWLFYALDLRDMETDFGIVPMPKYDEKQEKYYSQLSEWWADALVVPATVSDTVMVGDVLSAMGYYSQQILYPEVVNRTITGKAMRDDDAARMIDILNEGIVFDLYDIYQWGSIVNTVSGTVNAETNNFTSAYASAESAAKEAIAKTYEQLK